MYLGDIRLGDTIDFKFTSRAFATGVPTTLAGTPSLAAYVGNGTTEITAGITLSVDFDGVAGLNNVRVVASSGNGFATATNVDIVIAAGTVSGVSVVGEVVGSFSIEARSALMPTTAARTLDVSAGGEAGVDWANVGSPTTALNLSGTNIDVDQVVASVSGAVASVTAVSSGAISEASFATTAGSFAPLGIVDQGTAQSASATTVVLRSAAAFGDDTLIGATIMVFGSTQGYWQAALITDYVGSTDTATVATWPVTPSGTITYKIFATAPGSGGSGATAAEVWAYSDRQLTALDEDVTTMDLNNTAVGSVAGAVGSVTGNVGGNVTGSVGSVVGAVGSVTGAVGSVTGAVGSVTGAVGSVTATVDANIVSVIDDPVQTSGASDTNWGGAP